MDVADGTDGVDVSSDKFTERLIAAAIPTEGVVDTYIDAYDNLWVEYDDGSIYQILEDNYAVYQYFDSMDEVRDSFWSTKSEDGETVIPEGMSFSDAIKAEGGEVVEHIDEVDVSDWDLPADRPRFGGR